MTWLRLESKDLGFAMKKKVSLQVQKIEVRLMLLNLGFPIHFVVCLKIQTPKLIGTWEANLESYYACKMRR